MSLPRVISAGRVAQLCREGRDTQGHTRTGNGPSARISWNAGNVEVRCGSSHTCGPEAMPGSGVQQSIEEVGRVDSAIQRDIGQALATHASRQTGQVPPLVSKCCLRHASQNKCPQWLGQHASRRMSEQIGQNRSASGCASNTRVPGPGNRYEEQAETMSGVHQVADCTSDCVWWRGSI